MAQTVLVTGATGFIALHIVNDLLRNGFDVIGTVRSAEKGKLLENFRKLYPDRKLTLEFVADIAQLDAFDECVKKHPEIDFILHTASPFSFGLGDDQEEVFVKPAKNGTIGILKAAKAYGPNVKHVVVTSSLAAVMDFSKITDKSFVHTEETWNPMDWETAKTNPAYSYCYSKTIAERSAREFISDEKPSFTLSTVNPVYVFGPQMFQETAGNLNTSSDLINQALNLDADAKGPFTGSSGYGIDVRDVSRAHLLAVQDFNKFKDARVVMAVDKFCTQTFLDILNEKFPELHGKIPVGDSEAGKKFVEENCLTKDFSKSETLFGQKYISLKQSVYDTAKQILDYKKSNH